MVVRACRHPIPVAVRPGDDSTPSPVRRGRRPASHRRWSCRRPAAVAGVRRPASRRPADSGPSAFRRRSDPVPGARPGPRFWPRQPTAGHVRLRRRWPRRGGCRRLAVVVVLLARPCRAALGRIGGGPLATTGAPGGAAAGGRRVWIVRPGDTLWSIAEAVDPSGDVRPLVDRLART